jgi:hypothetical protein
MQCGACWCVVEEVSFMFTKSPTIFYHVKKKEAKYCGPPTDISAFLLATKQQCIYITCIKLIFHILVGERFSLAIFVVWFMNRRSKMFWNL